MNDAIRVLGRLYKISKRFTPYYIIIAIFSIIQASLGIGLAEALRNMINAGVERNIDLLYIASILGVGVILIQAVSNWGVAYLTQWLNIQSTTRLQMQLIERVNRSKMAETGSYHSGELIKRVIDSAAEAQSGINEKTGRILTNIFQVIFTLIYFTFLHPGLMIGSIVLSISIPLLASPFAKYIQIYHDRHFKASSDTEALYQDAVQGAEVIRVYSVFGMLAERYKSIMRRVLHAAKKRIQYEELYIKMQILATFFGLIFVFSYGGYEVYMGRLDVGAVAAFLVTFERLSRPISELSSTWNQLQTTITSARRVFDLYDLQQETAISHREGVTSTERIPARGIYLDRVTVELDGKKIIDDVSLHIEKHKTTAIVGPSGSGKSTLLQVIMRFTEPSSGIVYHDQVPIEHEEPDDWRGRIAYVPQEPFLISGDVAENLRLGRLDAEREDILQAARKAGIERFVTVEEVQVLDRGGTLSGGEKQRVAIARSLINPSKEYIILDEATASLDVDHEKKVLEAVREYSVDRTCIVVAHKLSNMVHADKIVFLEDGKVIEEGTHDELMLRQGKYYDMYRQAMGGL